MTEQAIKTQDKLLAEMRAAVDQGDFKAVSKISSEIAKLVAAEEKAEKDAKATLLITTTGDVKKTLDKAVSKIIETLDPAILAAMQGIWYANDFGEALTSCKLVKGAVRKAGGGGGGGKKFNITTNELLSQFGGEIMNKETGETYQQAHDSYTGEGSGNKRYNVSIKLLKLAGIS